MKFIVAVPYSSLHSSDPPNIHNPFPEMNAERTNHEKAKNDLNRELENVLKAATALASTFTSQEVLPRYVLSKQTNEKHLAK